MSDQCRDVIVDKELWDRIHLTLINECYDGLVMEMNKNARIPSAVDLSRAKIIRLGRGGTEYARVSDLTTTGKTSGKLIFQQLVLKILSVTENDDIMTFPSAIESGRPSVPDLQKWFNELRDLAKKVEALL